VRVTDSKHIWGRAVHLHIKLGIAWDGSRVRHQTDLV
jgi:hypothetical protein